MGYHERKINKRIESLMFWFGVIILSVFIIYGQIKENKEEKMEPDYECFNGRCYPSLYNR
jgi:hypothetical protein